MVQEAPEADRIHWTHSSLRVRKQERLRDTLRPVEMFEKGRHGAFWENQR